jgi:hypothetical protein
MNIQKLFIILIFFFVVICFFIGCFRTQKLSNLNNVSLNKNIKVFDKRAQEDFVFIAVGLGGLAKVKLIPSPKVYLHEQLSIKLDHESINNIRIEIIIKQINIKASSVFITVEYIAQIISDFNILMSDKVINKEIISNGIFSTDNPIGPYGAKESTKLALDDLVSEVIKQLKNQQSKWGPWIKIKDKEEQ